MMKSPFRKKKSFSQKVTEKLPLVNKEPKRKIILKKVMQLLFFMSLFLAGYVLAKIEILIN